MPFLTETLDEKGRPVFELFLTMSAAELEARAVEGVRLPAPEKVFALVDTGASRTFVVRSILEKFDLSSAGEVEIDTASTGPDRVLSHQFAVQLFFGGIVGGLLASDLLVIAVEDLSGFGVDMLLGCDVLGSCLLFFNGPKDQFTLGFDADAPAD